MTAKEYFRMVASAESRIRVLQAKLRHYEDLGLTITSAPSGSVSGQKSGASRVELAAVGMVDATRHLTDQIDRYRMLIAEAEQVISKIEHERLRRILTLRYLCGMSLRSISDELGYKDSNSVYRAHGYALLAAQRILDKGGFDAGCYNI